MIPWILAAYSMVDYLAGEERSTSLPKNDSVILTTRYGPKAMLSVLESYLSGGGSLFVIRSPHCLGHAS